MCKLEIRKVTCRRGIEGNRSLIGVHDQLNWLLSELRRRKLPDEVVALINENLSVIEEASDAALQKTIKKVQADILKLLEKELKLVPRNYYKNTWMPLGLCFFGVPIGILLGAVFGNMAMVGVGLPFGLLLGVAVGMAMDTKANDQNLQLDFEV